MHRIKFIIIGLLLTAAVLSLNACGGGGDITYVTVGGTVSGLDGTLVLQNNGGDDLTVTSDGAFTFTTPLVSGAAYDVTVDTSQTTALGMCVVDSPKGTTSGAAVTVSVNCVNTVALSGTLEDSNSSAMLGGVTIEVRNSEDDSVLASTETETDLNGTIGNFSVNAPRSTDFYLHVTGRSIEGTSYISDNLEIENESADRTGIKLYFTTTADATTVATDVLGITDMAKDAVISIDATDAGGNSLAGVTVDSVSPATFTLTKYHVADNGNAADFNTTGPSGAYSPTILAKVADLGGNATYTVTLASSGSSIVSSNPVRLRLIAGELSSSLEP